LLLILAIENLGERCGGKDRGGLKSVYHAILENAVNGDQVGPYFAHVWPFFAQVWPFFTG